MGTFDTKVTFKTIKNDIKKSDSAIREAVANAIDAKSKNIYIYVYIEQDKGSLGLMHEYFCLDIADDGDGIPTDSNEFEKVFCRYKVSEKKEKTNYGRRGKGRYTYLTLAKSPDNVAIYIKKDKQVNKISFQCKDYENIKIFNEATNEQIITKINQPYTTLIQFKDLSKEQLNIEEENIENYIDDIKDEIISFFADRIASKSINIYVNNDLIKIEEYTEKIIKDYKITVENEDLSYSFSVDFYIWNDKVRLKSDRQKHVLFFDDKNILKAIAPSGKNKLAFSSFKQNHSIIVKSKYFDNIDYIENSDDYTNVLTDKIIKNLRAEITFYLESVLINIYKSKIDKVSDEYLKFLKLSQDEITTRAYHAVMLPFIEKFGGKSLSDDIKSIIANLIDTLLKEAPESYLSNIGTILKLKPEDNDKIRYVEENYGIIRAISEKEKYIKRVDFLNTFSELVNGKRRGSVKERTMLHHVVDKNLWIFGEEFENISYNDISSDVSLKTILTKQEMYQFDSDELEEIVSEHKTNKVPDIFIPIEKNNIIYIIELKKPTVKINKKIVNEVMDKYVKTLSEINKKYGVGDKKKIYAIAVSYTKTENVLTMGNLENDGLEIVPKSWDEIINTTRTRYTQKIDDLNHKLKQSKWKDLEVFVLEHSEKD
ncbi:ATP-binding protein [Aliarcobacter butzleri]